MDPSSWSSYYQRLPAVQTPHQVVATTSNAVAASEASNVLQYNMPTAAAQTHPFLLAQQLRYDST